MSRENLIKTRRGTTEEWASANPTLANGEMGFETDTLKFKIGDGVTAWNSLRYMTFDGGNLDETVITGNTFGSINLSDYFDTNQPMVQYQGITGTTITVPAGYDYAIYIDSQGNVTNEPVTAGQILTFKSNIIIGTRPSQVWACQSGDGNTPGCVKIAGIINNDPAGYPSEAACQSDCCQESAPFGGNGLFVPRSQSCNTNCWTEKEICEMPRCSGGGRTFCVGPSGGTCCWPEQVCFNGKCCDPERICGNDCCSLTEDCCNGVCCPTGQVCGPGEICCKQGAHCNGICCGDFESCINGSCCPWEQLCLNNGVYSCCPEGQSCCNGSCCSDDKCCDGACCGENESCVDGQCTSSSSSSSSDSSSSADSSSSGDGSSSTDYYPQIFKNPTNIFSWKSY